ncbi:MAG: hypothetical protein Q4B26_03155 [Eubacteriales bacterium]|nr:hypothetical protein [Eubacteriales bacterium]
MSKIYSAIASKEYKNLLADPNGADRISVPIHPGNGKIAAGTVLYRDTATGLYAPAAAANVTNTAMLAVLGETVESGDSTGSGEVITALDAVAYRAGRFKNKSVTLANNEALTDAQKVVLRLQNIVFDASESTETFKNNVE